MTDVIFLLPMSRRKKHFMALQVANNYGIENTRAIKKHEVFVHDSRNIEYG